MKNENKIRWWAYLHTNGEIIVKRYFDEDAFSDADESPFVEARTCAYAAYSREEALKIAMELLLDTAISKIANAQSKLENILVDYEKLLITQSLMVLKPGTKRINNPIWDKFRQEYADKIKKAVLEGE